MTLDDELRICLITLVTFTLIGGLLWYQFRHQIRDWVATERRYNQIASGPDGIAKDLYSGKVRRGGSLKELIAKHPPKLTETVGEYTVLDYGSSFEGCMIIAKGDRLISASAMSCIYQDVLFDESTPEQNWAFVEAIASARTRKRQAVHNANLAVAGFGATYTPWNIPKSTN